MRVFHSDEPKALTKRKELAVHKALTDAGIDFDYQFHVTFSGCSLDSEGKRAFVDFVIPRPWGYYLLEVDECEHREYDPSCDIRRDFDIASSLILGNAPKIAIIRYNPDGWRVGATRCTMTPKDRHKRLVDVLNTEPAGFERIFMFYSRDAEGDTLPSVGKEWPAAVRGVSRVYI